MKILRRTEETSREGELHYAAQVWDDGTIWLNVSIELDQLLVEQRTDDWGGEKRKSFKASDTAGNEVTLVVRYPKEETI
jgi:hypothetical protein